MRNTLFVRRAERRISQMALARMTGIPMYRYWKIENEYVEPTPDDRAALAQYFGVDVAVLFPDAPAVDADPSAQSA